MRKILRVTFDFEGQIYENVKMAKNKKIREYTREIIKCFLSDPPVLAEFLKWLFFLKNFKEEMVSDLSDVLSLPDTDKALLSCIPKVSPETGYHIKTMSDPDYTDLSYEGPDGTSLGILLEQFCDFKITRAYYREIGSEQEEYHLLEENRDSTNNHACSES